MGRLVPMFVAGGWLREGEGLRWQRNGGSPTRTGSSGEWSPTVPSRCRVCIDFVVAATSLFIAIASDDSTAVLEIVD